MTYLRAVCREARDTAVLRKLAMRKGRLIGVGSGPYNENVIGAS